MIWPEKGIVNLQEAVRDLNERLKHFEEPTVPPPAEASEPIPEPAPAAPDAVSK